jgi:RNA polymerase sigma-70 factor, ECF subfamily
MRDHRHGRRSGRPLCTGPTGEHRDLLERYVDTVERWDIDALVALLHEDATLTMPPHGAVAAGFGQHPPLVPGQAPRGPSAADGGQRVAGTRPLPCPPAGRAYEPFHLQVVEISAGRITAIHAFFDPGLFRLFGSSAGSVGNPWVRLRALSDGPC